MRKQRITIIATVLLILVSSVIAGPNKTDREIIEQNYIEGINSDNLGLKVSSAYFLGEIHSDKAVIPLMAMLREDECDGARLAAALALIKIDDARGIYLVKRSVDFNDCEKVRKLAKHLYSAYITGGTKSADLDVSNAYAALK